MNVFQYSSHPEGGFVVSADIKMRAVGNFRNRAIHPYGQVFLSGTVLVERGFRWDGPSGLPEIPEMMAASAVHDLLYSMIRLGEPVTRAQADRVFYEVLKREGFPAPLSQLAYVTVRLFGWLFV